VHATPSPVRVQLITAAAVLNLVIGTAYVGFGVWILTAGVEAINTLFQLKDQAAGAASANPDVAQAADVGAKGLAAVLAGMAGIAAGLFIACGLPHLLIGLGIFGRFGWARVLGILFGGLSLLGGIGMLTSAHGAAYPLIAGGVFVLNGLVSLFGLFGRGAYAAYYAPRTSPEPGAAGPDVPKTSSSAGVAWAVAVLALVGCGVLGVLYAKKSDRAPAADSNNPNAPKDPARQEELARPLHGAWTIDSAFRDPTIVAFQPQGKFLLRTGEDLITGKYEVGSGSRVSIEYDVPEAVYEAQKVAFALAKKAFDKQIADPDAKKEQPGGFSIRPVFTQVEPVRSVKESATFQVTNNKLALTYPKRTINYVRATELEEKDLLALADGRSAPAQPDPGKPNPPKPDPLSPAGKEGSEEAYGARLKAVMTAIEKGQVSRVRDLLVSSKLDINDRDENGETMLMRAVAAGQADIARYLIDEKKADFKVTDKQGNDLFLFAATRGRSRVLNGVLSPTNDGKCRLKNGNEDVYRGNQYIEYPYVPRERNDLGQTPWMAAAAKGHLDDLVFLRERTGAWTGVDKPDARDANGKTALDLAVADGHTAAAEFIRTGKVPDVAPKVEGKLPKEEPKKPGELLLLKAVRDGDTAALIDLLKRPDAAALLEDADDTGTTALMAAAQKGNVDMVAELCKALRNTKAGPVAAKDSAGKTALIHAAVSGYTEVCELLLIVAREGWEKKTLDWFEFYDHHDAAGKSALEYAEGGKHTDTVKALKDRFVSLCRVRVARDVSAPHPTALERAAKDGKLATVKRMLALGAPQSTDLVTRTNNRTPLMWASEKGHPAIVKVLLESFGGDNPARLREICNTTHDANEYKYTALHYAAQSGEYAVVRALLDPFGNDGPALKEYIERVCAGPVIGDASQLATAHPEVQALLGTYRKKAQENIKKKDK
jgi:ankyrin repeat protein